MKSMASVTYNFIQKISSLRSKKSQENELSTQLNKSDNIMTEIRKILIWDDPFFSCCCIISVNIIFWLIVYLGFKFYGIIFAILLILTCEQLWMEHLSKYFYKNESNFRNLESDSSGTSDDRTFNFTEINTFFKKGLLLLKEIYVKAQFFRQSQPGMFCILTCTGFLFLGVIGRSFSTVTAFYILLMLIMTIPGILIRCLPPEVIKSLADLFCSSHKVCSDNDNEVESYLPDTSKEALQLLKLAGDDEEAHNLLLEKIYKQTNETTESIGSQFSFYPESSIMPSPENSMDNWEFQLQPEEKTDLNDTENNDIYFQSKHFDGDSSEEEFVRGLDLSKATDKKSKKNELQKSNSDLNTEGLVSVSKKVLVTDLKQRNSTESEKELSSDTDSFEMISEEDM